MSLSQNLLSNLNEQQHKAVTLGRESAMVLAGAGSGKTKVLTTRIAYLIQQGMSSPGGILAVTFTNKAAKEMTTRLSSMLPINTRGMWIGTFHGLCNRFLRAHYREAGLPQTFQILDSGDQQSMIKRMAKAMNLDETKYPPKNLGWFINGNKDSGLRAHQVDAPDPITRKMVEFFAEYDAQCTREGVVDFAELLLRTFETLGKNPALLDHYRERFRYILVDEFQDTNNLQYNWLKMMAGNNGCVFAVGDDDQCLVGGSQITMADGTRKAIERVKAGEHVMSCYGNGRYAPALVSKTYARSKRTGLVEITTAGGHVLRSTPEHTHFAGYLLGDVPQTYFTYLMHKRGVGYRLGTSQVYTKGQAKPIVGYKQRSIQEHADELWIIGTHASENAARQDELLTSLRYGLPTLPFTARKSTRLKDKGLAHDAQWIASVYAALDTEGSAKRLLKDRQLSHDEPHHVPRTRNSNRRNIGITLVGDGRGVTSLHRISVMGNDAEGKRALEQLGLSVRPAKTASSGSNSWRYEASFRDFGQALKIAKSIQKELGGSINCRAGIHSTPLPFVKAASVRAGMAMMTERGQIDYVTQVRTLPTKLAKVYDLDIDGTHNFIANGIVTHNSIYGFRGAEVGNMQSFRRDFNVGEPIKLEQNYRSFGNILNAANAVIANNTERLGKNLWTDSGEGEPIRIYNAISDQEESEFIIGEIKNLHRAGEPLAEIALLYRSNAQSRMLEQGLIAARLKYRVYGGMRFFERQEVKHALAYLRLASNPDDDGAFLRVVNFPPRGIGARSIEMLQEASQHAQVSLMRAARTGAIGGRAAQGLLAFSTIIDLLVNAAERVTLPELVEELIVRSTLREHYQSEKKDGEERLANLDELVNAAASFVQQYEGEDKPLVGFLTSASLESGENEAGAGEDAVQLMTVHSSKGLEFNNVFLSGLEEGLFPHENGLREEDGLEEERRLMYVAITRARKQLFMSYAASRMLHGQVRYGVVSRFLEEVPEKLTKWIVPPERAAAYAQQAQATRGGFDNWNQNRRAPYGQSPGQWRSERPEAFDRWDTFRDAVERNQNSNPIIGRGKDDYQGAGKSIATKQEKTAGGLSVGQNVRHGSFGDGVIIDIKGSGPSAQVEVRFGRVTKLLAVQYAKLVPI
jgi:DNA helicase II / ATP-dependent DNA helicase PcrA